MIMSSQEGYNNTQVVLSLLVSQMNRAPCFQVAMMLMACQMKHSMLEPFTVHLHLIIRLDEHPIFDPRANVRDSSSAKRKLGDINTNHSLLEVPLYLSL